ncbi:hypothetical protein [Pseudoalteromonas denitrificans]|uniref:Uncharacterized protein n=1 Tax=Pseudoalteromonas denitrificans DSM 6059 TaxID=1123010 RepID=A0A1I1TXT2_9GAMM|nr:hypothetical protein [Pseudoalteromonas denitrificans]SFD63324.1 hypothetical protein SAMN02745724_05036 [Pseudoalteromonas denitrificans DSM 6059]
MSNFTKSKQLISILKNESKLLNSISNLDFIFKACKKKPKCSSLYLEKSLLKQPETMDVSFAIFEGNYIHWFEYDNHKKIENDLVASEFLSLKKTKIHSQYQVIKCFLYERLKATRYVSRANFLFSRLHVVSRNLNIEHFGYMASRRAFSLRICSSLMSVEEVIEIYPFISSCIFSDDLTYLISLEFGVKLSLNISASIGSEFGLEIHSIKKGPLDWIRLFTYLERDKILTESQVNYLKEYAEKQFLLSKDSLNVLSIIEISHLKLSFHLKKIKDVKIYYKVSQLPFII